RLCGAGDRFLRQLARMGVAGGLAGDRAQSEALARVEARALQSAVVVAERFRLAVFEEQLSVVGALQRLADAGLDAAPVKAGAREEQVVGQGEVGHERIPLCLCPGSAVVPPVRGRGDIPEI